MKQFTKRFLLFDYLSVAHNQLIHFESIITNIKSTPVTVYR